jgi:hypothetical protein
LIQIWMFLFVSINQTEQKSFRKQK